MHPRSLAVAVVLATSACRSDATTPPSSAQDQAPPVLVGPVERADVEKQVPGWISDAEIDGEAAAKLASVPPGAEVTIIFGTWCGDSRREVPRLWRAFDAAGAPLPFTLKQIGVDTQKTAPQIDKAAIDLRYVPTIIVSREGREVGRIVESVAGGVIERELLALLDGSKTGLITGRTDLGPSS
ncbi:TlpA family protein disulfide reductase [Nannocystis bainbridge]|uniref:Thioredoxin family protein n=1 Tax=Nannocystis bainbridge TaxID=2995303 RepID=A0ABT5EC17_9BACT|nr:thioredoxin family protein [Nannocystis bainbridge]MDC0722874.1 thioredoxin family protein [Nannocystis bainbridge]